MVRKFWNSRKVPGKDKGEIERIKAARETSKHKNKKGKNERRNKREKEIKEKE
jgi:hypothetical protein